MVYVVHSYLIRTYVFSYIPLLPILYFLHNLQAPPLQVLALFLQE